VSVIDTTTAWLLVVGLSLGTYLLRASFLLGAQRFGGLPPEAERLLRFVPTAVLAGLAAPSLLLLDGVVTVSLNNYRLLAGAVAVIVAWRTEDMFATVGAGMVAFWVFRWLSTA
jgi:branched-subunit amino acid transport protein